MLAHSLIRFSTQNLDPEKPFHESQLQPESEETPTREEIWQRYGLVLVQRSQGKWKTWEKVGSTR